MSDLSADAVRKAIAAALEEDLGTAGDITTDAVISERATARADIVARQDLVLAGVEVARQVFLTLDDTLSFDALADDGAPLSAGERIATVAGNARAILRGERTALNFLGRMCGIAGAASAAMTEIEGTGAVILDTRKTAPGLRALDKYAVACGGARNHRHGLHDAAMIKDTHLEALPSLGQAVRRILSRGVAAEHVTVEVRDLAQLQEAIEAGAGRVLLDNMSPALMRDAVRLADGRVVLEASGGLRPGNLRGVAETGVDCLSLGYLTHSAPAADVAMEMVVSRGEDEP